MAYVLKIVFYLSQYVIKVNHSGVKYFDLNLISCLNTVTWNNNKLSCFPFFSVILKKSYKKN